MRKNRLKAIPLLLTLLACIFILSGCTSTKQAAAGNGGSAEHITITRNEYESLRQKADERYVTVPKTVYDSLSSRLNALQELVDILSRKIREEKVSDEIIHQSL